MRALRKGFCWAREDCLHSAENNLEPRTRNLTLFPQRMAAFLVALSPLSALLGDVATIASPCKAATASLLYTGKEAAMESDTDYWVALEPMAGAAPAVSVDNALLSAPPSIKKVLEVPDLILPPGAPLAVGRLRCTASPPIIDCLRCSLPKENKDAKVYLGLVLDSLLLAWSDHVRENACSFDDLAASGSFAADEALRTRGFAESENVDFTRLGKGESLVTHAARLEGAVEAAQQRAAAASAIGQSEVSPFDILHAETIADALRGLDSKVSLAKPADEAEATPLGFAAKKDPWAGIKGFGMS